MVGEGEVDDFQDGEEIHFSRVISAAGSSSYRFNDKEVQYRDSNGQHVHAVAS